MAMHALKAHVRGGRLLLDEPTELPEGSEVELLALDDEDFDPAERAELIRALEEGAESIQRGDVVDGIDFATQLLARRADQAR